MFRRELTATYTAAPERRRGAHEPHHRRDRAAPCWPPPACRSPSGRWPWTRPCTAATAARLRTLDKPHAVRGLVRQQAARQAHAQSSAASRTAWIRKELRSKAGVKSEPCIFVGYSADSATYKPVGPGKAASSSASRDVYFVEGSARHQGMRGRPLSLPCPSRC